MFSKNGGSFKTITLKNIRVECTELQNVFFIGKKYEWLKDYPALWEYKFFQGFNSLNESKKFLGFSFISDDAFINLFGLDYFDYLQPLVLAKNKENVVRLYKNLDSDTRDLLKDYLYLCREHDIEIEIPAGINKLTELHDLAVWKANERNAECYSKEYKFDTKEEFTKVWKERGLEFKRLTTPYEMYLQGLKQQHCIGTNYATTLGSYAFYTFTFKEKEYDIQLYKNGSVGQFRGKRNKSVPQELVEKVTNNVKLNFELIDIKPNLTLYPMLRQSEQFNDW